VSELKVWARSPTTGWLSRNYLRWEGYCFSCVCLSTGLLQNQNRSLWNLMEWLDV